MDSSASRWSHTPLLEVFAVYCCLYPPQVLLPALADRFSVASTDVALLIGITMGCLMTLPPLFGSLSQKLDPSKLLAVGHLTLAVTQFFFPLLSSLPTLLLLRGVQGVALACAIPVLMAEISARSQADAEGRTMKYFVSATIFGGFFGRWGTGVSLPFYGETFFFLVSGGWNLLMGARRALSRSGKPVQTETALPPGGIFSVLTGKENVIIYANIFACFLAFSSVLNYLPFRLKELNPSINTAGIGMIYLGYLTGIVTSLLTPSVAERFPSFASLLATAVALFGAAALLLDQGSLAAVTLLCGSFFFIHTLLVSRLNRNNTRHRETVNGVYVAAYYLGGVTGSYFPGLIYRYFSWSMFLWSLFSFVVFVCLITLIWCPSDTTPDPS